MKTCLDDGTFRRLNKIYADPSAGRGEGGKDMMQQEFEKLVNRGVTEEQYRAFEILYNESDLNKQEFARIVKRLLHHIPKPLKKGSFLFIGVEEVDPITGIQTTKTVKDQYLTIKAEIIDVDISTGKIRLKKVQGVYFTKDSLMEIDFSESSERILWEEQF